jgi:hypothetical protein
MTSVYAWCESAPQVRYLRRRRRSEVGVFVAVWPDAAWELKKQRVDYVTPDAFYDESAITAGAETILEAQQRWASEVDEWLATRVAPFREVAFEPTRWSLYHLKALFDQIHLRSHIIREFLRSASPSRVVAFEARAPRFSGRHLGLEESLDAQLWPLQARASGTRLSQLPSCPGDDFVRYEGFLPDSPARSIARRVAATLPPTWQVRLRRLVARGSDGAVRPSADVANAQLIIGSGYDLDGLRDEAARRRVPFCGWDDVLRDVAQARTRVPAVDPAAWDQLTAEPFFWNVFRGCEREVREVAAPRLRAWWQSRLRDCWPVYVAGIDLLRRHAPKAAASLPPVAVEQQALVAAARHAGVPVAMYQHGGFVGVCEHIGWDILDLSAGDVCFTYGDGVTSYFDSRHRRSHRRLAVPMSIGSARLDSVAAAGIAVDERDSIRRRLSVGPDTPIVLYVPTAMMGYSRQLCRDSCIDMQYFDLQLKVFDLFARHARVAFVYKPFINAIRSPLRDAFASICSNGRWTVSPRLTRLMWAADAIAIDFPSTGLLEAALTSVPIVALADRNALTLTDEGRRALQRRATLAESAPEFLDALSNLAGTIRPGARGTDDHDFDRAFGRHLRDGCSASRGLDALLSARRDLAIGAAGAPTMLSS